MKKKVETWKVAGIINLRCRDHDDSFVQLGIIKVPQWRNPVFEQVNYAARMAIMTLGLHLWSVL